MTSHGVNRFGSHTLTSSEDPQCSEGFVFALCHSISTFATIYLREPDLATCFHMPFQNRMVGWLD